MLLPSALSCDGGRAIPSSSSMLLSPVPRHATRIPQVALFAPTTDREESSSSLRSSAVEGIFMTCKKLHQILSLEPPRSASATPHQVSAITQTHNAFNHAIASPFPSKDAPSTPRRNRVSQAVSTLNDATNRLTVPVSSEVPQTPTPKTSNVVRVPKTPIRRNKRHRVDDSDDDDGFSCRVRVQTPKRPRLSAVPTVGTGNMATQSMKFNRRSRQLRNDTSINTATPERVAPTTSLTPNALQLSLIPSSPQDEVSQMDITPTTQVDSTRDWSNAEDRLLVEMVLQKMRLSPRDWADCARSLGRDPRTVGNRWEMIVGSLIGESREARVSGAVQKHRRLEDTERS